MDSEGLAVSPARLAAKQPLPRISSNPICYLWRYPEPKNGHTNVSLQETDTTPSQSRSDPTRLRIDNPNLCILRHALTARGSGMAAPGPGGVEEWRVPSSVTLPLPCRTIIH